MAAFLKGFQNAEFPVLPQKRCGEYVCLGLLCVKKICNQEHNAGGRIYPSPFRSPDIQDTLLHQRTKLLHQENLNKCISHNSNHRCTLQTVFWVQVNRGWGTGDFMNRQQFRRIVVGWLRKRGTPTPPPPSDGRLPSKAHLRDEWEIYCGLWIFWILWIFWTPTSKSLLGPASHCPAVWDFSQAWPAWILSMTWPGSKIKEEQEPEKEEGKDHGGADKFLLQFGTIQCRPSANLGTAFFIKNTTLLQHCFKVVNKTKQQ